MFTRTKWFILSFLLALNGFFIPSQASSLADSVNLYTPYTKITVPPGESVDYAIDIINKSSKTQTIDIYAAGIPKDWNYSIKSGSYTVSQLSILPGEKKSFNLNVSIPLKVNKGNYGFKVYARGFTSLPLYINVSKQGTFKTDFTSDLLNMQGHSGSTFTFNASLKNQTADKQIYALIAEAPAGWTVTFKAKYKQVTSVEIDANNNENITIDIVPPANVEARTFEIPVKAYTSATSAIIKLQVVISGSYKLELTTPTGLLSNDIVAGETKRIELLVKNTGSSEISGVKFTGSVPAKWEVSFEPNIVEKLIPGSETTVFAVVKADKKAIPGDYAASFNASINETSSKVAYRISVNTSLLTGWFGVLVILLAIGIIYYLFRKFGRR